MGRQFSPSRRLQTSQRFRILSASLLAVGLAVVGFFIVRSFAAGPSPTVSGVDYVGISAGGNLQWDSARDQRLAEIYFSGAKWVRFDMPWSDIQSGGPNSYNWTNYDAVVDSANRLGLKVLATLGTTPVWARPPGVPTDDSGNKYPPANMQNFANFASAATAHFAPKGVHYWEIWNEPNLVDRWSGGANAAVYDQMLSLTYPSIKQADPTAIVVSGGLGPHGNAGQIDNGSVNPITFLQQMYQNHGGNSTGLFDAFGLHPYFMPDTPDGTHSWNAWYQMFGTNPSIRSVMTQNGDADKKIWMTEVGIPAGPNTNSLIVTEATQAADLARAYTMLKNWSWAGPLFWFNDRDANPPAVPFGITKTDGSPKLAFLAMQQVAHGLLSVTKDPSHAPLVYILSPQTNTVVKGSTLLNAIATDVDSPTDLAKVEFYVNGKLLGPAPIGFGYFYTWDSTSVPNGSYQITAKAYDKAGHSRTSQPIAVTVQN